MSTPCTSPGTRRPEAALSLRPARPEDAAELSRIALGAKAALGYAPQLIGRWRAELSIDARIIREHLVWAACLEDGRIAGFFSLILCDGGARLDHLWVATDCQRQGIGGRLMDKAWVLAIEHHAGAVSIDAEPLAEAFYLRQGFHRVAVVAAPIPGSPERMRPQMLRLCAAGST